jgi:hypothetical protein
MRAYVLLYILLFAYNNNDRQKLQGTLYNFFLCLLIIIFTCDKIKILSCHRYKIDFLFNKTLINIKTLRL